MIPKIIHQLWIGSEIPHPFLDFSIQWRIKHPGWIYVFWSDRGQPTAAKMIADLFPLVNQDLWERAAEIAPRAIEQFRSDVIRYEILDRFGGLWIDMDFEPRKPLDPLIDGASVFLAWEKQDLWASNAILGAEAGHGFLTQVIDELPAQVAGNPGAANTVLTGPQFITPLVKFYRGGGSPGFRVADERLFFPYSWNELDRRDEPFPDAVAVHHWNNRQRRLKA